MGGQFVLHIDATALTLSKPADAAPQMNVMLFGVTTSDDPHALDSDAPGRAAVKALVHGTDDP